MINLPFKVGPGVADRHITGAEYINGSFVFVDTITEFQELSTNNKYSLKEGVPVYVRADAAGNIINKIYKYKKDVADVNSLPSYEFLAEDLEFDHLYVWKNNEWFDITDLLDIQAIKDELNELKRNLSIEIATREQNEANINLRLEALEKLGQTVIEIRNELSLVKIDLDSEVNRATEAEKNIENSVKELNDNLSNSTANLRQNINEVKEEVDKNKLSIDGDISELNKKCSELDNDIFNTRADLTDKIEEEKQRAKDAEDNIRSDVGNNKVEIGKLQRSISDEALIRQNSIEQEANERKAADTALTQALNDEITRAKTAEQNINDKIGTGFSAEDTVAKKINDNKDAIEAEVRRATGVEGSLDALNENLTKSTLVDAINSNASHIGDLSNLQTDNKDTIVGSINEVAEDITNLDTRLSGDIKNINDKIPATASESNKLADQAFVNSSINAMAAFYITRNEQGDPFFTNEDLTSTTSYFSGGVLRNPTKNDYAIVVADESVGEKVQGYESFTTTDQYINYYVLFENKEVDVTADNKDDLNIEPGTTIAYKSLPTTRYTYQGEEYPNGQWQYQYIINRTALTAAQIAAINSGITKNLTDQITINQNNITDIQEKNNKQDTAIAGVKATADKAASDIGNTQSLTTNAKDTLVNAINELNSNLSTSSSTLQTAIENEKNRAIAEEEKLQSNIDTEAATARAAEKENADNIAAEAARAKAEEAKKVNSSGGELKDTVVTFDDATVDANIVSGETTATLFGKIKRWFGRLKALAFKATVGTADIDNGSVTNAKLDSDLQTAVENANNAMPKSGGKFTGRVSWQDSSLPAQSDSPYFVTIEAFANGGKTYYTSQPNVKRNLGVTALEDSLSTLRDEFDEFSYKTPTLTLSLTGETSPVDLTATNLTRSITGFTFTTTSTDKISGDLTFSGEGKSETVAPAASGSKVFDSALVITFAPNKTSASFTLKGTSIKQEQLTASASITSYYPLFYGASATTPTTANFDSAITNTTVSSGFGKKASSGNSGSYTISYKEGDYVWFCTTGTISKITSSGYDVTIVQDGTLSYKGGTYKLYRTLQLTNGSATFVI